MSQEPNTIVILMADDDPDDQLLCSKALKESSPNTKLVFVEDGQQLLDYLKQMDNPDSGSKRPTIILLDLNMPKKDGREALKEIKSDPALRKIPIIVFSTSKSDSDVETTYDLGVNSFITKPLTYKGFVDVMSVLSKYWFETTELPNHH